MEYEYDNPIIQNRLNLRLKKTFVGQLLLLEILNLPAFAYINGIFEKVLDADEGITNEFISQFAQMHGTNIFIHEEDYKILHHSLREELTKQTRSLSIGDPKKNANKHVNLLSMQMGNLYDDPFNDELLSNQFQNSKNLSALLLNNKDIHKGLYDSLSKSRYHYTLTQPLLSSIVLLSFLQTTKLFNEREIESLFLTSYFKDIGMSFIPREKFELSHLTEFDKKLFADHSENSMKILEGRVQLNKSQLNLIKNHHYLNYKIQSLVSNKPIPENAEYLTGIESMLVSALDILVAMTQKRPYREEVSPFKALELLKKVISDEYPSEFKALVIFIKNFHSK